MSRILLTALVSLGFFLPLRSEELNDRKSQTQARFPGKFQRLVDRSDTHFTEIFSGSSSSRINYIIGNTQIINEKVKPRQLEEVAKQYLEGVAELLGEIKVIKQGPIRINDKDKRVGHGFILRYAQGYQWHWITIANNRIYMVTINGPSESVLITPEVKSFLDSIIIKDEPRTSR